MIRLWQAEFNLAMDKLILLEKKLREAKNKRVPDHSKRRQVRAEEEAEIATERKNISEEIKNDPTLVSKIVPINNLCTTTPDKKRGYHRLGTSW